MTQMSSSMIKPTVTPKGVNRLGAVFCDTVRRYRSDDHFRAAGGDYRLCDGGGGCPEPPGQLGRAGTAGPLHPDYPRGVGGHPDGGVFLPRQPAGAGCFPRAAGDKGKALLGEHAGYLVFAVRPVCCLCAAGGGGGGFFTAVARPEGRNALFWAFADDAGGGGCGADDVRADGAPHDLLHDGGRELRVLLHPDGRVHDCCPDGV